MKRKVVKLGPATLVISLPSKWIRKYMISAGDEVLIDEIENGLMLTTNGITAKSETYINLIKLTESSIRTLITNTYRCGFDKIIVNFDSEDKYRLLSEVVKARLIGFDITKTDKSQCIVESITEPTDDQFDNLLQRMIYNISELFEITEQRFNNKDPVGNYHDVEEKIQQYDNFCRRVIAKRKISVKNSELFWTFLGIMVHAQREIYLINRFLDKNKINVSKDVLSLLRECRKLFEMIKKSYLKKEIKLLEEVHELEKKLVYNTAYKLLRKNNKENVIIYHLTASVRHFYLSTSPLMGLLI